MSSVVDMTDPRYNPQPDERVRVIGGRFDGDAGTVLDILQDVPGVHELAAVVELDGVEEPQLIEFIHLAPLS